LQRHGVSRDSATIRLRVGYTIVWMVYTSVTSVYHEILWYITYLFHDRRAMANTGLRIARSTIVTLWSRFSGVGYGTLFHSRYCVER